MKVIKMIFKRLTCEHKNTTTITNIYGDVITYLKCRSIRECNDCGKIIKDDRLDPKCNKINDI